MLHTGSSRMLTVTGCLVLGMAKSLGPVAVKLGDEVPVKVRNNTTIKGLLQQLHRACKGGRMQDAKGFYVTAYYSQDLPEGEYAIKQLVAGGPLLLQFHQISPCSLSSRTSAVVAVVLFVTIHSLVTLLLAHIIPEQPFAYRQHR